MKKDNKYVSDYPPLVKPNIQSKIPEYLVQNKEEDEQHLLHAVDRLEQKVDWSIDAIISTHDQVRQTNGRLKRVEAWKAFLSNIWVVLSCIGVVILGITTILFYILDIVNHVPK